MRTRVSAARRRTHQSLLDLGNADDVGFLLLRDGLLEVQRNGAFQLVLLLLELGDNLLPNGGVRVVEVEDGMKRGAGTVRVSVVVEQVRENSERERRRSSAR